FGDLHFGLAAVDGRHLELAAERGRHHRDRHAAMQVGAVALEEAVPADRQKDVEVARRPPTRAGLALAGEADAGAVLDAGRNVDRERAVALHAAGAGAGRAGIVDHLTAPMTRRTGPLEGEEALRLADLAVTRAGHAGLRLGAALGAAAGADLADDRGGNADLRALALERLLEADLHAVADIGAALAAPGAPPPAA